MTPHVSEWLGAPGAAKFLGINLRTLYALIDSGQLEAYRFGRVYRLKTKDLDTFIESARVKPGDLRHLHFEGQGVKA